MRNLRKLPFPSCSMGVLVPGHAIAVRFGYNNGSLLSEDTSHLNNVPHHAGRSRTTLWVGPCTGAPTQEGTQVQLESPAWVPLPGPRTSAQTEEGRFPTGHPEGNIS